VRKLDRSGRFALGATGLLLALGVFLLASVVLSTPAQGDGMVIRKFEDRWQPLREGSQQALILQRDGLQRMLLAIEVDDPGVSNPVWILPVPAGPGQVTVDVLADFPRVSGTEVFGGARDSLSKIGLVAAGMQVWPAAAAILYAVIDLFTGPRVRIAGKAPAAKAAAAAPPITVHQRVEKEGMVAEVITAKEGGALYRYLEGKGLKITPGSLPVLDHYAGKDYTFITSWLGGGDAGTPGGPEGGARHLSRGIEVRFPSREMFFPLRPTSVYGEAVVPASIWVAGYVTPRPYADIAPHTTVRYHVSTLYGSERTEFARAFYEAENGRYTRIDINTASRRFTDDLWIDPASPGTVGLAVATFVVTHGLVTLFLIVAALSAALSLAVGWVVYEPLRTRRGAIRLAVVGLANCLTLIGLIVAGIQALPGTGKRFAAYLAVFSILYVSAVFAMTFGAGVVIESLRP